MLTGTVIPSTRGSSGQELSARFEGRLEAVQGVLQGKYGARDCTLTLARAGG